MKPSHVAWLLLIAMVAGTLLRGIDILEPYENGHRGACCAFFGLMANNHLRHGLFTTGGVGILNPVWAPPEFFNYYLHHPPGSILIATIGAALGGARPFALRLIFLPLAMGIALLTYRLARSRDARVGFAAGGLAALLPIATYYGAFVNFEIPTLFFLLLALFLFLRWLRRGRSKDRWRFLIAQAIAVGCDWIALGLPITLLVLAPLRRRRTNEDEASARSFAGTAALGVAVGLAVVVIVKVWYQFQLSRYGMDPDAGAGLAYYRAATPAAIEFTWPLWLQRMSTFSRELITVPVLVTSALGLIITLKRAVTRCLAQLDVAALATTAIGIGNVVILGNHALKHDYYLLYLAPACALLTATLLRALYADFSTRAGPDRIGKTISVLVVLLLVHTGVRSYGVAESRRSFHQATLGMEIAEHTDKNAVVLLVNDSTAQVAVQADRFVLVGVVVRTLNQLEFARSFAIRFGMARRPHVLLLGRDQESLLAPGFADWLGKHATRADSGPFLIYDLGPLN